MKKWTMILITVVIGTICTSVLLLSSGVAFAATTVEGLPEILLAGLDALMAYLDFLLQTLELIFESSW